VDFRPADQASEVPFGFQPTPEIGPFYSVGSVVTPTIKLFKNNFWLITKIIFVIFAPFEIFKALSIESQRPDWQTVTGLFLLGIFCKALVAPSLIYALMQVRGTGVAPSLSESYRVGLSKLPKLMICAIIAWVLQMLGFLALVIPGIILGLAFELIYPLATLENLGPLDVLKRSCLLTRGYRWRILGATIIFVVLTWIVMAPFGIVASLLASEGSHFWPLEAAAAMLGDIVGEATTILSLVIYLSITSAARSVAKQSVVPHWE
jgi:uncharacterized membrane protein